MIFNHSVNYRACCVKYTFYIQIDHTIKISFCIRCKRSALGNPRIIHQNINTSELFLYFIKFFFHTFKTSEVRTDPYHFCIRMNRF